MPTHTATAWRRHWPACQHRPTWSVGVGCIRNRCAQRAMSHHHEPCPLCPDEGPLELVVHWPLVITAHMARALADMPGEGPDACFWTVR